MKNVFDFFSCKSWMILRKKSFDTFTNKLSLRRLEKDTTWEEALEIGEYTSNLCNTFFISQVNDYIIIDNINLERDGSTISKDISIDDDFVFNMTIDIWVPYMFTEIYRAGALIRSAPSIFRNAPSTILRSAGSNSRTTPRQPAIILLYFFIILLVFCFNL